MLVPEVEAVEIENKILNQYPNGWTCMRDVEDFRGDLYKFYYGEEDLDDIEDLVEKKNEFEEALELRRKQGEQIDANIHPTIKTLCERTERHLSTSDMHQDRLVSILALCTHGLRDREYYEKIKDCFHNACLALSSFRDDVVAKYKPPTMSQEEFVGKALWSVQADAIRKLQAAPSVDIRHIDQAYVSNDFSFVAIMLCLDILTIPEHNDFVKSIIIPVLAGYSETNFSFESIIRKYRG
jgi:hypothetical protein